MLNGYETRKEALDYAIKSSTTGASPNQIIYRAKAYEAFLKGDDQNKEQGE